jgi:hypothetical protein
MIEKRFRQVESICEAVYVYLVVGSISVSDGVGYIWQIGSTL